MIRQPIVSVLGHVDHGKTTLLDKIRGSAIAEKEAGGITQHIGATEIPLTVIKELCGGLLRQLKIDITIPGLLFIDTPGHEAFISLRKRGGALADLAVLVVDIVEGFQPQTLEALNILRTYKTPFLVAANKIDRLMGWQSFDNYPFTHSFSKQQEEVRNELEKKIYELVGELHNEGFQADRFDRVEKFEKQIAMIPVSAKTGEGIPELLMMLVGLAQKFLGEELAIAIEEPAKGTILEVKEEIGLGTTIDVILYDGRLRRGDRIAVGGSMGPIVTKVRSLLKPKPLDEIRDPRFRFDAMNEVLASSGVKVAAPNLEHALAGYPLRAIWESADESKIVGELKKELEEVKIEGGETGVIIKGDSLGSVEALVKMLQKEGIPIYKAGVGDISRRDVIDVETVKATSPTTAVVIGFNVKVLKDGEDKARESGIRIFQGNVVYRLVEEYQEWAKQEFERVKQRELESVTRPGKIRILPGYVFRISKPAIVGVEVMLGVIRDNYKLMDKDGKSVGVIKSIQDKGESIGEATMGKQVAISIDGAVVGRHIKEGDVLYTEMGGEALRLMVDRSKAYLSQDEIEALEEIKAITKTHGPLLGVERGVGGS